MNRTTITVNWEELLNAYQGSSENDEEFQPLLDIDSGEVLCAAMLDPYAADDRLARNELLRVPTKNGLTCHRQRAKFAHSLCDETLANRLDAALSTENPFESFDRELINVPVEQHRWREEERTQDLMALSQWMSKLGYTPDPPAKIVRKIIEFPFRKSVSTEED